MLDSRRFRRSAIWNVFTETHKSDFIATCNICSNDFSYKTTTTNLFRHLEKMHPGVRVDVNFVRQKSKEVILPKENSINEPEESDCKVKIEFESVVKSDCDLSDISSGKLKSPVWEYFRKIPNSDSIAGCNYCHKELSYKTTTHNLKRHLERKHFEKLPETIEDTYTTFKLQTSDDEASSEDEKNYNSSSEEKNCNSSNEEKDCTNSSENDNVGQHSRRYVSPVWNFFTKLSSIDSLASCNICCKKLSYKTTTTNLQRHIERKHPQHSIVNETQKDLSQSTSDEVNCTVLICNRKTSAMWNYFTRIPDYDSIASCNFCQKKLSYKTTTWNLKCHLERKHKHELMDLSHEQDEIELEESFLDEQQYEEHKTQEKMDENTEFKTNENVQDEDNNTDDNDFWNQDNSDEDPDFGSSPTLIKIIDIKTMSTSKRRSKVWNVFTKKPLNDGIAICNVCNLEFSYRTTTNNLKKHFEKKHPTLSYDSPMELSVEENVSIEQLDVKPLVNKMYEDDEDEECDSGNTRKRSQIWNYFIQKTSNECIAICKICKKELSFKSTISDLRKHLDKKHPNVAIKLQKENKVEVNSEEPIKTELHKKTAEDDDAKYSNNGIPVKSRKRRSLIWNYFTRKKNDAFVAICNICKKQLKFKSSIWDLKKHLNNMHPHVQLKVKSYICEMETTDEIREINSEIPQKKSLSDIQKICYICLQTNQVESREFTQIKNSDSQEKDYLTKIQEITHQTKVIDESHVICKTCIEDLEKVLKFRKSILTAFDFWSNVEIEKEPESYDNCEDFNHSDCSDLDDESLAKFTCSNCNKEFDSSSVMLKHTCDALVTEKITITSDKCHKIFSSTSDVSRYNCSYELKKQTPPAKRRIVAEKFCCERCGMNFPMRSKLNKHLGICQREVPQNFVCSLCGKMFKKAYHLREHMASHTGEHNYSCKLCGKTFQRQSSKYRHMRAHNAKPGEKSKKTPFLCTICGKSFPYSNGASRHMRVHLGIKRHQCHICLKRFMEAAHLKVHIRTHTGERPYGCMICGRAFSLNATLRKHMRLHNGDEKFT